MLNGSVPGKNGRSIVEDMLAPLNLKVMHTDQRHSYSNDFSCHLKPDGTLTVKIWHMQAMLQPPTSRAAKLITGIGHDVEDDHLRRHDAARAREWIYYTKAHW